MRSLFYILRHRPLKVQLIWFCISSLPISLGASDSPALLSLLSLLSLRLVMLHSSETTKMKKEFNSLIVCPSYHTFDPYFLGSKLSPIFCIPLANIDKGLVRFFNCLIAFSLWEFGKLSGKSLDIAELKINLIHFSFPSTELKCNFLVFNLP